MKDADLTIGGFGPLAEAVKKQWVATVDLALGTPEDQVQGVVQSIADRVGVGVDSLKRKFGAIQHQATLGFTSDEIIRMGQEKVLGAFIKSRKVANYQEQVWMKWWVPGSQRKLVQDAELRVRTLLNLNTSVEFWDWFLAMVNNATDQEIIDSAAGAEEEE